MTDLKSTQRKIIFIKARAAFACTLFLIPLLLETNGAHALKTDSEQPIKVRAHAVEINEKTGVAVYRGNVVLTQGSMSLHADRLELTRTKDKFDRAQAEGQPAKLRLRSDQGQILNASAQRIEYRAHQIDFFEDVTLQRDEDIFNAAVAHYHLINETFSAEGGANDQASAIIQPAPANPQ